jgi:hypothetical protein
LKILLFKSYTIWFFPLILLLADVLKVRNCCCYYCWRDSRLDLCSLLVHNSQISIEIWAHSVVVIWTRLKYDFSRFYHYSSFFILGRQMLSWECWNESEFIFIFLWFLLLTSKLLFYARVSINIESKRIITSCLLTPLLFLNMFLRFSIQSEPSNSDIQHSRRADTRKCHLHVE